MQIIWLILKRGLGRRCQRCGVGPVFRRWHEVAEQCSHCHLDLQAREGDCWAFMYITTAFLTGLFFMAMLLYRPANLLAGRITVTGIGLAVLVLTLPYRKSLALAIDYHLGRALGLDEESPPS